MLAATIAGVAYYARFNRLVDAHLDLQSRQETAVYSSDGQFLSSLYGADRQKRRFVEFEELPPHLVKGVLAAEDERFFQHPGFDLMALMRALYVDIRRGERAQGGSTLTQQFVKNFFLTPDKTIRRKLEELYFAVLLENRFTKEEIFTLYANDVYMGQAGSFAIHGFAEASSTFLGKSVADLSLSESALLAGIIQAPNRFSPLRNPERALQRRDAILKLMEQKGFVDSHSRLVAMEQSIDTRQNLDHNYAAAPYFVDLVRENFSRDVDWRRASRVGIVTTLDSRLQKFAYQAVREGLDEVARSRGGEGAEAALIAVRPASGEVVALIGGRDYASSQYNRATHAFRPPGSAFKPFVYAAALQESSDEPYPLTLNSRLMDQPRAFVFDGESYAPSNSGDRYHGLVSLREALAFSLNVPTVQVGDLVGLSELAEVAERVGLGAPEPFPSLALGAFETTLFRLTEAYTVFPNQGRLVPLRLIQEWTIDGRKVVPDPPAPVEVFDASVAFIITTAMQSVLDEGTGREVRARGFYLPAAGKTGTNQDGWFVGFTPDLLCAVWVGFDDGTDLPHSGSRSALPIWTNFMKQAYRAGLLSGEDFSVPESAVRIAIDARSGLRAAPHCREVIQEYYVRGTEPFEYCRRHVYEMAQTTEAGERKEKGGLLSWLKKIF